MSAVLTSPMPMTRPKIHRLPASHARKPAPNHSKNIAKAAPYAIGAAIVLALLAAIPPQPRATPATETVAKATLLPQISVTPREQGAVIIEPAAPKTTTLAMNNAQALPPREVLAQLPAPSPDKMTDESKGKTINLQGKNESIVGQMARIPLENEQITEIKSVSDIDNSAGRELLSIINKY